MWFLLFPLLAGADNITRCASGILEEPYMSSRLNITDYPYPDQAGVVCSMTFIYKTRFCEIKRRVQPVTIVARYAHLPRTMTSGDDFEEFCVVGEHLTTCFCLEPGCNTNVPRIMNIFNSNLNHRKGWTELYREYNKLFVEPQESDEETLADCLFNEFPVKWSEGIDDESATESKPEEKEKEKKEEKEQKTEDEDDSLVFQVTFIGGIVPLLMLVFSYGVFNSMEAKRQNAKMLLAYDQRPGEEDEAYGPDLESDDEVADEAGKGPALQKGKKRSAEAARDGQGIHEMTPQSLVDGPRSREEAPRSREEAPRSKEEAPRSKEDAAISQGDLIGPRDTPKPRKGARDRFAEDEDDGYESVDPNAPIPPAKKESKPPPDRKKKTKSKPAPVKKKPVLPTKTRGKKTGGKPAARPKRPASAPPKRRRR